MKTFLKIFVGLVAALSAVLGVLWFEKSKPADYIEIYSEEDDSIF